MPKPRFSAKTRASLMEVLHARDKFQIPPDLVVKSQAIDIVEVI
jgi:hypothetical protein